MSTTARAHFAERIRDLKANLANQRLAQKVAQSFGILTLDLDRKDWYVQVSQYRQFSWRDHTYEGPTTITVQYDLNTYQDKPWREISQDMVAIRRGLDIGRLTRSISEASEPHNTYTGERKDKDGNILRLRINTGTNLPPTCTLVEDGVEVIPAYTQTKYKVVCK